MSYGESRGVRHPRWLKIHEAAELLNVSKTTVRRLLASGALEAIKVGRAVRVDRDDLDRYVAEHRYAYLTPTTERFARMRQFLRSRHAKRVG